MSASSSCPGVLSEEAGRVESCQGCPNTSYCSQKKHPDPDVESIAKNLHGIKVIVAVMSGKGGVGKSMVTRNIADAVSKRGIRTCILDFDFSGPSVPKLTGTDGLFMHELNNVIYPVEIGDFLKAVSIGYLQESYDEVIQLDSSSKTSVVKKLLKNCDYGSTQVLLIDTPPNISDEHLGMANFIKPKFGVVVTTPQELSLQDVVRQIDFCKKTGVTILGIVENMKGFVCSFCHNRKDIFTDAKVESYCTLNGIPYFGSICLDQNIAKNSDFGMPVEKIIFEDIAGIISSKILESEYSST